MNWSRIYGLGVVRRILFVFVLQLSISSAIIPCGQSGVPVGHILLGRANLSPIRAEYLLGEAGIIQCVGVISSWRFRKNGNNCNDVDFNVWRPTNGNTYRLVGRNAQPRAFCENFDPDADVTFPVGENERIPVMPGDIIGWSHTPLTSLMIPGNIIGAGSIRWRNFNCNSNPGQTCNFGSPGTGSETLAVSLQAVLVQGFPPTLDNLPVVVNISENQNAGSYVFAVSYSHKMNIPGIYTNVMKNPDPVRLLLGIPMTERRFRLANTNLIQTNVRLNFEERQQYQIPVTLEGMLFTITKNITINVLDRNDPHTIVNVQTRRSVSALGNPQGTQLYQVAVLDEDIYNPTTIYYSMVSWTITEPSPPPGTTLQSNTGRRPPFKIHSHTGVVTAAMDLLDFEYPGQIEVVYDLVIRASDGQHQATSNLELTITNLRQPPRFTNLPATITVEENTRGGTDLFKVVAIGSDPQAMEYSLIRVTPPSKWNKFTVDPGSGVVQSVMTGNAFDYLDSDGRQYRLDIGVTDGKLGVVESRLIVNIGWVDQTPYYQPNSYHVVIPEKCGDTFRLCTGVGGPGLPWWPNPNPIQPRPLRARDRDVDNRIPGNPDSLTCNVQPGFGSEFFTTPTSAQCGVVQISQQIDVDTFPQYQHINLTLRAIDNYGKAAIAHLQITVFDINDHQPVFSRAEYSGEINENTNGGVSILTVTATDGDSGENAEITYSLVKSQDVFDGALYFEVHPRSGVLSTKQPVDYERLTNKWIRFRVLATDGGNPPRDGQSWINITILDVNDNHPQWPCDDLPDDEPYVPADLCFYNMELRHDTLINYVVHQLQATDVDTVSPNITFFLLKPDFSFLLTADAGEIIVKDHLEAYKKNILYCYAQDNGHPNLLSTPTFVRVDAYPPDWHLVDITLAVSSEDFNDTQTRQQFISTLRRVITGDFDKTWFAKIESYKIDRDKTTVTIYALEDNSTYIFENLRLEKKFVDRNDLLGVLRRNIFGTPREEITIPDFKEWLPILVMPAYPFWLLDTVPGLVTLGLLCLLVLGLVVGLIVGICKQKQVCCFAPRTRARQFIWPISKREETSFKDIGSVRQRRIPRAERYHNRNVRRDSTETIHSNIYQEYRH